MKRISCLSLLLLSMHSYALSTQNFKDNTDLPITLSDINYNRLVVRGDKITKAHFPEGALAIKNEDDGSLYIMVSQKEPFTLFLTTELGHHFSTTVSTESTLGKTLEFVAQQSLPVKKEIQKFPKISNENSETSNLMLHLLSEEKLQGFKIKHHYGRVIRLQQGLVLIPKLTYTSSSLVGEVTEIYNGGKTPLYLTENLFASPGVRVVSFSKTTLKEKEKGLVYRIVEQAHG